MKTRAFLYALFAFAVLSFTSCGDDDDDVELAATGISLNVESLSITVDSTTTLIATLEPEGATGDISWSSSDASVAAINNGIVTALKTGEATIVAACGAYTATCSVTVTEKETDPEDQDESLQGSDYYLIQIDESSYSSIKDKVIADLRPDDVENSKNLFVWESTFTAGTCSGLNFYGESEGWVSFIVGSVGWSGAGYNIGTAYDSVDMTNLYNNPDDYVFHIALKSSQTSSSYLFTFEDGTSSASVCIGSYDYVDNGVTYAAYADFTRDGEWHSIEIPVSKLKSLGVYYNEPFNDANVFSFLAGGTAGVTLDMDAIFFYKPAE